MTMMWGIAVYLFISLILGEGYVYHSRKTGEIMSAGMYIILILFGPPLTAIFLLSVAMGRGPK